MILTSLSHSFISSLFSKFYADVWSSTAHWLSRIFLYYAQSTILVTLYRAIAIEQQHLIKQIVSHCQSELKCLWLFCKMNLFQFISRKYFIITFLECGLNLNHILKRVLNARCLFYRCLNPSMVELLFSVQLWKRSRQHYKCTVGNIKLY